MDKIIYTIDGNKFNTLESFYDEISNVLMPGASWGRNLDAFNDILRGGFGTPEGGFILVWENAKKSKKDLGYKETLKWLKDGLDKIDTSNLSVRKKKIALMEIDQGETLFMILVDIILNHSEIELRLK